MTMMNFGLALIGLSLPIIAFCLVYRKLHWMECKECEVEPCDED